MRLPFAPTVDGAPDAGLSLLPTVAGLAEELPCAFDGCPTARGLAAGLPVPPGLGPVCRSIGGCLKMTLRGLGNGDTCC